MTELQVVGRSVPRRGLDEKLTGQARYTADLKLPEMLHARALLSPHPHADVISVDASAARAVHGIHAILTPFDEESSGPVAVDMKVLDMRVRFVGDEVAVVAAETEEEAERAVELLRVEYRPLPFVTDSAKALRRDAAAIHPGGNLWGGEPLVLERGDAEAGMREADIVLEETYEVASHSAAPLEPRSAVARWDGDALTVWKTSRGVHQDRAQLAAALGIPPEKIRVMGPHFGAGYGAKDESRCAALAAILSRKAGRPVRLEYSRYQEFVSGRVRHGAVIELTIGLKKSGEITAISNKTLMNTGAYLASGAGELRRAAQGALYLYRCPNVRYEGRLAYTNAPVAGSYRGLGAPQGHFALETLMERAAEAVGMAPLEFRLKNHVGLEGQPGRRISPKDQIIDTQPVEGGIPFSSNGLRECVERGAEAIGWDTSFEDATMPHLKRGVGIAMCIYRGGPGQESTARVVLHRDGGIDLHTGVVDVGQGSHTVLAQMAAETLGCEYEGVRVVSGDSDVAPYSPITAGSTATFSTGLAVQKATAKLRSRLLDMASTFLERSKEDLDVAGGIIVSRGDGERLASIVDVAQRMPGAFMEAEASVVPGSPDYIVNSFAAHFALVEVDLLTGNVSVLRYVAAHDSGRIINPLTSVNQVEGGVSQTLGLTLSEELVTDAASGVTLNGSFLEHKCPTIGQYPEIQTIFVETDDPIAPFGAKALGEPPSVPVAAAVVNAVHDAIGVRFTRIPLTPDIVIEGLARKAKEGMN